MSIGRKASLCAKMYLSVVSLLDSQNEEHDKKSRGTYRLLGHFDCERLFGKKEKIKI